jgi:phosphoribosylpyrophosphate synthetase
MHSEEETVWRVVQSSRDISPEDVVIVSPDVGGVARARAFAKKMGDAPLAIVDKRRQAHNVAKVRGASVVRGMGRSAAATRGGACSMSCA